jgi:hypothetical protein
MPRQRRRFPARFGIDAATLRGVVGNLSEQGLYLTASRVFPPGTVLTIEILADDAPCRLAGVVRWARQLPPTVAQVLPSGMGIRLTSTEARYTELVFRGPGRARAGA